MKFWMKALILILVMPLLSLAGTFKYNRSNGKCMDASGKVGLNPVPSAKKLFIRSKVPLNGTNSFIKANAECVDFSGADFIRLSHASGYVDLINWDLMGSKFSNTNLNLVRIYGDMSGADFSEAIFRYTSALVKTDRFTKHPNFCIKESGSLLWSDNKTTSVYDIVCVN